jgi:hypothetical protein
MNDKFETWAIVELFGHNKIAGKVSEQTIGGSSMVRVDVPDTEASPKFTRLLNVSAIYAINPVTEEVAVGYAGRLQSKPIEAWDAREVLKRIDDMKKLNAPVSEPHGGAGFDGPEDDDEETHPFGD